MGQLHITIRRQPLLTIMLLVLTLLGLSAASVLANDSTHVISIAAVTALNDSDGWVQWTSDQGGNSHYYRAVYVPTGITWDDAQNAAADALGYLAKIQTTDENQFVFNLVSDPKFWHEPDSWNNREGTWLGGLDPNHTLSWQWANGETWDYTNWSSGEPNNMGSEDAVIYFGPGNSIQSVWNNVGRSFAAYGYVIERDDAPSFDLAVSQQDIMVTPSSPFTSGTLAHVSATIHNISDIDGSASVHFSATDGTNIIDLGTITGLSIPANSSATATIDQNTSGLSGTFTYAATVIDPSLTEASTANNSASISGIVITNTVPIYYGYNPNTSGTLTMVGFSDDTNYSIVSLDEPVTTFTTGALSKGQSTSVGIPNLRHFKVESNKPMFVYLGYDCCAYGGSFFFPAIDGMNRVGTDYSFLIPVLSGTNEFVIWAYDDADVTITRPDPANPSDLLAVAGPIHLSKYQRWETTGSPLSAATMYYVHSNPPAANPASSGRIALECNTGNGQAAVPSANGRDMGKDFVFKTHSWGGGAIAVFAYEDADVTCTNTDANSVLFDTHINKGQTYFKQSTGRSPYHLTATGNVAVWAGDCEGGGSIADMGDDITINQGNGGREFYLHSQTQGAKIFCAYDGTIVSVTNVGSGVTTTYNRDRDGFIDVDAGLVLHIVATNPVIVQTLGGNGFNDWGNTLNPVFGLDSGCAFPPIADAGPDITVVRGRTVIFDGGKSTGDVISYQWDFDNDGVPDSTSQVATYVFNSITESDKPVAVKLTVANGNGCQTSDIALITVRDPIPFDLAVFPTDINVTPASPVKPGVPVHISAVVHNISDFDGIADVKFSASDGVNTFDLGTAVGVSVPQQSSAVAFVDSELSVPSGSFSITTTIVNVSSTESSTENNSASLPAITVDGVAPAVSITDGPNEGDTSPSEVTFAWSGSDNVTPNAGLLFSFKLDNSAWSDYSGDVSYQFSDLADGQHVFSVKSKDQAGNESSPATRSFTVDATSPTINSTLPVKNATGVATGTAISAVFNEAMDENTITSSTFALRDEYGSIVEGSVSYDSTSYTATLTPSSELAEGTVYTAAITTAVTDRFANPLASDYSWSFTTVAPQVSWVSWLSGISGVNGSATGVLTFGDTNVDVNYTGEIAFIQTQTSGGANYWKPATPYLSARVGNAPPAPGIIALSRASAKTLTFSKPVTGLLFAIVSLNGNGYRFNQDFDILSYGCGYWGCGTLTKLDLGDGTYQLNGASGEPHGVIRFKGAVSSITWTSLTNEYWNGFTVGTYGVIIDTIPPDTIIADGPAEGATVCDGTATIDLSGSDDVSQMAQLKYQWRLDGDLWSDFSIDTSIVLNDLQSGPHTFEAAAKDEQDNVDSTPVIRHFTVDLNPPVITSVSSKPSQLQAAISWLTDKDSTSQVEYGKDSNYGSLSPIDSRMLKVHNVTVTGLDPDSTYNYRVKSKDGCGRETMSADFVFATSADSSSPDTQIISGPGEGSSVCEGTATFGFTGSDDTTPVNQLQYRWRIDGGAWSTFSSMATADLTGLGQGIHTFEVAAEDAYGKIDSVPAIRHFTVSLNPPVISPVGSSPSQTQVTLSWTTDQPATSQVEYGSDTSYGSATEINTQLVTSHSVSITGLLPNTTYHFRVKSKNSCERESQSDDGVFSTLADDGTPETTITNGPREGGLCCSTTVNIGWTGTDNATPTDKLIYSWRMDSTSWSEYTSETSHMFTGLSSGSHTLFVRAKDTSGNVDATPAVLHFTVDLSSPTISGVAVVPQATSAIITWQTSKPATSFVEYGSTSSYGSASALDGNLVTSHSVTINGLTPETAYHLCVRSNDGCGREAVSDDVTFTTTADSSAPNTLVTSGPSEGGKACSTTVRLCWTGADDATPADQLTYSFKLDSNDWSDWNSNKCQEFDGLADGAHTLSVRARDTVGNIDGTPAVRNFVVDTAPPNISNIVLAPHQSSVTVSWITNELTSSQVEYGTTSSLGSQTSIDSNKVSSHKMTVTGLTPNTAYYMRVRSSDGCAETMSDPQVVTTTAVLPSNLVPQMMMTPMSTSSGQELQVSWTIKNVELGDAPSGWMDGFYLSDTETLDSNAIPLGQFGSIANLSGLFSYTNTQNLKMPILAPGLHYLILKTDDGNAIAETNEDDNIYVQAINFTMPKQLTLSPDRIQLALNPGVPVNGQMDIANMGTTPLTGITANVQGASANVSIQVDVPDMIDALTAKKVGYTITANDESVLQNTPTVQISSAEGPSVPLSLNLYVIPRQPVVTANPSRIEYSMIRGKQTTIDCEISNGGAVPANDLQVNLPNVPWLSLISPKSIGTLGPGEKTKISLLLKPDEALPLGPYDGNFAVAGSNGGVSVGFRFNAISDKIGDLKVIATDEFTFFADDHPNVTDATVTLTDAVDGHVIFESMVDDSGVLLKQGLPEGHYNLEVRSYKHSTDNEPVQIVAGQLTEIKAFMRRQMVSYTWNVEPVQIEDKYKIDLEATFETHVPAPVVTVDPPYQMIPVLEGHTTQINYTITNHGLIAAMGVTLDFQDSDEFYIVPLVRNIGTLAAESSIVVPVLVRAKSDGPIQGLPSVATDTAAAQAYAAREAANVAAEAVSSPIKALDNNDSSKPCNLIIQGKVIYYYKCVNDVLVAVPIDTTPLKIGKEIYDIIKCGLDLAACAGSLALGPEGAPIAADKCPDAIRCLFKYTCEIISANLGTPCCFCKIVSAILGDTGEMGDAANCLPKPSLNTSKPPQPGELGLGISLNLPSNGFAVNVTPWDFGQGVPGKCNPGFGPAPTAQSNMVKPAAMPSKSDAAVGDSSDISKYGGKEVRYRVRCY